jgi:RNA polymerase sigma factor (sigma-70 family)
MKHECPSEYANADAELLTIIMNGDVKAFDKLYKRFWKPLLYFASQFIEDQDSCKEIVQGLFVHLLIRRETLKVTSAIRPYLYTSLRNRINNHIRDRTVYKRHIRLASKGLASVSNDVEQFVDYVELKEKVATCLSEMPVKYREVYLIHFQHQYTIKKVAFILNRPVDTVEKQLRKAKAILRSRLLLDRKVA